MQQKNKMKKLLQKKRQSIKITLKDFIDSSRKIWVRIDIQNKKKKIYCNKKEVKSLEWRLKCMYVCFYYVSKHWLHNCQYWLWIYEFFFVLPIWASNITMGDHVICRSIDTFLFRSNIVAYQWQNSSQRYLAMDQCTSGNISWISESN